MVGAENRARCGRPDCRVGLLVLILLGAIPPARVSAAEPRLPGESRCFGQIYTGTRGDAVPIWLHLVRSKSDLSGSYYEQSDSQYDAATNRYRTRELYGNLAADGQFVLRETDRSNAGDPPRTGRIAGTFDPRGEATGSWESASGERSAPFHIRPVDSLEQGREPRWRLRFAPGSLSDEPGPVWFSIAGGPELVLTRPDNKAVAPCFPPQSFFAYADLLDPGSVQVRRLGGEPDVYWMTYDLKSEYWNRRERERRQRVVLASDTEHSLFDEWSQDFSGSGNGSWSFERSEDYAASYRGDSLNVVKTTTAGEEVEDDCGQCEYAHDSCTADCDSFKCARERADTLARCLDLCRRDCEREDWMQECYAGKITLLSSASKRVRKLEVPTGRVESDQVLATRTYTPGWFRCSSQAKAPLRFLVRDDGRTAWLLVRDAQQGPVDLDPETPVAIPAHTACWLYNREPWDKQDGDRVYPSAPPDQLRPNPVVPEDCCILEVSADGKRTFLYGKGSDEKPGALLAVVDNDTQGCYSANVAQNGRWGKAWSEPFGPDQRMTLGSGGRLRSAAFAGAPEIRYPGTQGGAARLAIGTPVLVLGRSALATRVAGVQDYWYYVVGPQRVNGWAFGGLLTPFDSSHPEQAYRRIVEHYLAAASHDAMEEADFAAFLGRLRAELPKAAAPAGEAQEGPRRLLERFDERMQTCRTPGRALQGHRGAVRVQSVPRHSRITLGAGVLVRPDPQSGCGQLQRLPLGTVVSVTKRTAGTERIGDVEDRWYQVQTADGILGWVFGGLLAPFDPAHPQQAYRVILERHAAAAGAAFRDEVEFLQFLGTGRAHLPPALSPDLELARLDSIDRLAAMAPAFGLETLSAPWLAAQLAGLEPYLVEGYLRIGDAYWGWHDRNPRHPAAERAAWRGTRSPRVIGLDGPVDDGEAEGEDCDEACAAAAIAALPADPFIRYLALYPLAVHAAEAAGKVQETLSDYLTTWLDEKPEIACWAPVRQGLEAALGSLQPVKDARVSATGEAGARIRQLITRCMAQ
jgi:hypothetical protein